MIDPGTEEFYSTRAEEWARKLPHDRGPGLDTFLDRLEPGAHVLDLGCGDGRDAEYMIARGFRVNAADGIAAMVELAKQRIGDAARLMRFDELDAVEKYDAVWANASLQHAPARELPGHLQRVYRALKPMGWHFSSYKGSNRGGDEDGGRDQVGRFFSFITAERLRAAYESAGAWDQLEIDSNMGSSFGGVPMEWHNVTSRKPGRGQ